MSIEMSVNVSRMSSNMSVKCLLPSNVLISRWGSFEVVIVVVGGGFGVVFDIFGNAQHLENQEIVTSPISS